MAIPLPNLDDRRWLDLVEEGRALLPLYAPEWTDHNASDPGITLMELLAWVAEMDIYRLNRVPDRHRLLLLALAGVRPHPPRPARVALRLQRRTPGPLVHLPAGIEASGLDPAGARTPWRTLAPLTVLPAGVEALQVRGEHTFQDLTPALRRGEPVPAFGAGGELYVGLSAALPAGQTASFYLNVAGDKAGAEERRRTLAEDGPGPLVHHGARTVWEHLVDEGGSPRWLPLDADDDTRALSLRGLLRVRPSRPTVAVALGAVPRPLHYLRCRLVSGAFDTPPRLLGVELNVVEAEQSVPVRPPLVVAKGVAASGTVPAPGTRAHLHLRLRPDGAVSELGFAPVSGDDPAFTVLAYQPPSALAAGSLTLDAASLGPASGEPHAAVPLPAAPVDEDGFELLSYEGTRWRRWARRFDLVASSRRDRHFVLDAQGGWVHFGDGEHGRVPPAGAPLLAVLRGTRAGQGGLDAGAVTALADGALEAALAVTNPWPSEGGHDAETLAHATGRAVEQREAPLRAVTLADFEALTVDTPGTHVARVTARANLYPGLDCVAAPGVVTVVVVPDLPGPRPTPSAGLLRRVAARLERRRLLGTRVIVTAPRFRPVSVHARVKALPGADPARLRERVAEALRAFFDPRQGGPDGGGWPFGRDVYRSEVMQVIDETPGVDHVSSLELHSGQTATCGNLCLPPTWLPASEAHQIEVS
jgi:hypothetical protein